MKTLITGHPRSATGFFAMLMQAAGLDIGHEKIGEDGISSWLHIAPGGSVPWAGEIERIDYDRLVHVVRNPLDVIASSQTMFPDAWDFIENYFAVTLPKNMIERAMFTWIEWNKHVESINPNITIRVEDVRAQWSDLMKILGHVAGYPAEVRPGYNSRPHNMLSWADLESANPDMCDAVREMAERYGYSTQDQCVTISAAMIVKNEEKNLARCLDSIADLVDEIVIVDTGSTDRTVDIAERYGAKVFHSPWRDDFSFHRNESIGYASCDWILRIDADEELILSTTPDVFRAQLARVPERIACTRNLMEDMQSGGVAMTFQQNHFFRRGRVRYKNRKHNYPVFDGPVFQLQGIKTRHYGYEKDQIAGKKERDLKLLLKMREEDPDNYRVLYYLSQTYGHYYKDSEKALKYCQQYIETAKDKEDFNGAAYVTIVEIAKESGHQELSEKYLNEGLDRYPNSLDINFLMVRESALAGDADGVERGCAGYLKAYDQMRLRPAETDGRFTWFFNSDALIYVLHKATVCHLHRGIAYLEHFHKNAPNASDSARDSMMECMQIDLDKIGVGVTVNNLAA